MFYKTKIGNVYVIGLQNGDEVSINVKEIAIKMELGTAKLFNNLCNFNGKRMDDIVIFTNEDDVEQALEWVETTAVKNKILGVTRPTYGYKKHYIF